MNPDRELLELAAKACGYDTSHQWNADRLSMSPPIASLCIDGVSTGWNPLEDDAHALRMAVKLGIDSVVFIDAVGNGFTECYSSLTGCVREFHNNDKYAATRRAIVRAAVEIGKTK